MEIIRLASFQLFIIINYIFPTPPPSPFPAPDPHLHRSLATPPQHEMIVFVALLSLTEVDVGDIYRYVLAN